MKLSDYIVEFFESQNVKDMFMVSGGGCMHLVDSFGNSKKIKYWCTHHEQAAAMAAEAYSKINNDLGIVLTTSGPGATNTITAVLDCWQDSTPVVFISGQAKSKQTVYSAGVTGLRQFGVQEANIIPIVQSITKYAVEVNDPNEIRYHLEKAVYEAKHGRFGPVWLSVPLDVQSKNINPEALKSFSPMQDELYSPKNEDIDYLISALKAAKRPVVIGGHGVRLSNAIDCFERFISKFSLPVVTPIMGIDILSDSHPSNIGRIGTKGTRAGNFAMQNADLIISMGSRLSVSVVGHEYNLFAREAKVIVIDIDKVEHKKNTIKIDRLINCDILSFLEKMDLESINCNADNTWLEKCQKWKEKYPVVLNEYNDDSSGINYYKFIDLLNEKSLSNMPFVSDAGSAFYVVAQTVKLKQGQRHITTGSTATMGFTLPAAIGVSRAMPTSCVLAITGEGSLMQNLQELEVLRLHNMNIKVFVMCNEGYFSIHQTQKKFFKGHFVGAGTESGLSFPDFKKLADAFELDYYKIDTINKAESSLNDILTNSKPALIEITVNPNMEIIPTNASLMRGDGSLVSKPLEDMYPFLQRDEFKSEMIVKLVNED